jgi:hypothetical protein
MTSYDTLLVLARLILPADLLDCFDIVEIENDVPCRKLVAVS